ncbi:reverse transcriptase domain-containing protein [Tanacetum coccineum]
MLSLGFYKGNKRVFLVSLLANGKKLALSLHPDKNKFVGDGISLLHEKVDFVATLGGMKLCFGVNTKFAKPSILGKPVGQPLKNQSVVRQPTAFKSERPRISKPRFASQVDVNNDLSKPVTTHHLPKGRESAPARPHHMIAPSSSSHKVVRLGINPMIQPELEDLPKDNPKLEIAVLRSVINELTSGEIVSLNFIESIKEARSRVQDLTSGEIVSLNFIESIKEARSRVQDLTSGEIVSLNLLSRTRKLGHSTMELRVNRVPTVPKIVFSEGYGQAFHERILDKWGIVDVDNCCSCAQFLVDSGSADGERLYIIGGSANGYTTLAALAFTKTFKAGPSLYGVSNILLEVVAEGFNLLYPVVVEILFIANMVAMRVIKFRTLFPYGPEGVFRALAVVYWLYTGFDMVANMAKETKKPAKDIPLVLVGSMSTTPSVPKLLYPDKKHTV